MGTKSCGQIYLYGERHCQEKIMKRQLKLWYNHYHNENLRYLFLEHCYCATEFLNIWMRSDSDDILEMLYEVALAPNFPFEYFGDVPCLGYQLKERYGEAVHFEDLSYLIDCPV